MRPFIGRGGRDPITSRILGVTSAERAVLIDPRAIGPTAIVQANSTARGCDVEPTCAHTDGAFLAC